MASNSTQNVPQAAMQAPPAPGAPGAVTLLNIDLDIYRPCQTDGKARTLSTGANEQRRHRLKKDLVQLGLAPATASTFPNQDKLIWGTQTTRPQIEQWGQTHIPGWTGQYRGGINETGARLAQDVNGKGGKGGARSLPVGQMAGAAVAVPAAAAVASAAVNAASHSVAVALSRKREIDQGQDSDEEDNEDEENEEDEEEGEDHAVEEADMENPSSKRDQDLDVYSNSSDDESIEDPTDYELQLIEEKKQARAARRANQLAALEAEEAATAAAAAQAVASRSDARDEHGHYIDRTGRDWDPEYDTEEAEDDLPFEGYFTTLGQVKKKVGEPEPIILALVKKSERRGGMAEEDEDNGEKTIPKEKLGELDLEVVPRLKGRRKR